MASGNFDYLHQKPQFADFAPAAIDAERSLAVSYSTAALQARRGLESAGTWVPYQDNLSALIHEPNFKSILETSLFSRLRFVVELGNKAAHTANWRSSYKTAPPARSTST
jgi:type I restriction enzyme R subunit